MWSGSLHDSEFVGKALAHVEENTGSYGTSARMKGMLTLAKQVRVLRKGIGYIDILDQELDLPFYFTPAKIAGIFHSICPPLEDVA
jgi:tRNA (guanine26-N2/guanine27-N2)-dimethyltransferase